MRPATLVEVGERLVRGEPFTKALAEFLDAFYSAPNFEAAAAMLADGPPITGYPRADAILGAVGDYLSMQYQRMPAPRWTREPDRFLPEPLFTSPVDTPSAKAWLMHSSPAEFKHHNIFTEAVPLRRKLSDNPVWARAEGIASAPHWGAIT